MTDATQTLAAIFSTREAAHAASEQLHDAGFHETWIGVTHEHDVHLEHAALDDARGGGRGYVPDAAVGSTLTGAMELDAAVNDLAGLENREMVVEDESDSLIDKIGRFFSGAGDMSLHEALVQHGISETDAQRLEDQIVANDAILLVNAGVGDAKIQALVEGAGGRLLTDMTASVGHAHTFKTETPADDLFVERPSSVSRPIR